MSEVRLPYSGSFPRQLVLLFFCQVYVASAAIRKETVVG